MSLNNLKYYIICSILFVITFYSVYFPLVNTDIWWHLTAGRYIVENHQFIYQDPFSVSAYNDQWINVHWLFQIIMYVAYAVCGLKGIIIVKAFVFAISCVILFKLHPQSNSSFFYAFIIAVLCYSIRFFIFARPTVFSLLFIGAFLLIIERFRTTKKENILWLLIPLQICWVNMQGLFPLGLVILACYIMGDGITWFVQKRFWHFIGFQRMNNLSELYHPLKVFAILVAVCLVNPYGYKAFGLAFELFNRIAPSIDNIYSMNVSENMPIWTINEMNAVSIVYIKIYGIIMLGSFILKIKNLDLSHLFLFVVFLFLGTMAYRNIPLYLFVTAPILISNISTLSSSTIFDKAFSPWKRIRSLSIPLSIIVLFLIFQNLVKEKRDDPDSNLAPFRYPIEAVKYLKTANISGNMFNSVSEGGYIMWEMFPQKLPFIDGRLVIRSRELFDRYLNILDNPQSFYSLQKQYNITHVVLPISINQRYLKLASMLYLDKNWSLVFLDASSMVLVNQPQMTHNHIDLSSSEEIHKISQGFVAQYNQNEALVFWANSNFNNLLKMINEDKLSEENKNP